MASFFIGHSVSAISRLVLFNKQGYSKRCYQAGDKIEKMAPVLSYVCNQRIWRCRPSLPSPQFLRWRSCPRIFIKGTHCFVYFWSRFHLLLSGVEKGSICFYWK